MSFLVFFIITIFIAVIQTVIPYLVNRTVVFGVMIPEQYIEDKTIEKYRKQYSMSVGILSIIILGFYIGWMLSDERLENQIALTGVIIEFALILISLSFYLYYHGKTKQLKQQNEWVENLKPMKVMDLSVRKQDEMLPWYVYLLPILSTVGLLIYTLLNYELLPDQIPTHWGPSGEADAFTDKTHFSAIQLSLLLLTMQLMFLGIHVATKKSGIKLSATALESSRNRQLSLRKYSSWLLYIVLLGVTMLMSYFQLMTIHPEVGDGGTKIVIPFGFLLLVLIGTLIFAIKVGRSDKVREIQVEARIMDIDEDKYWKGGMFYFNQNDPSIFVEKRFGVGWTINLANPFGYVIVFVPLIIIILISLLL
ncbi:DUF1648 domain-containing protein [Lysinibacillus sp. SGAir0095]|uniref:DUF1648 domain-containing protein n=1 Tax=Lysinibacillus sp. SGAir0095 TaxID=2070463 RepID=UPI0010CD2B40|nr:DUF5808 domain-containing protein [Lysinibacillus sp. SGAir0095]QCR33769.1 hypothetical protein C1N55_17220 [Lysinibacillus sp. SGAir0095]